MKKALSTLLLAIVGCNLAQAQEITQEWGKLHLGDNAAWKEINVTEDGQWRNVWNNTPWSSQGISNPNAYAWYRFNIRIPKSLLDKSDLKEVLRIRLGKVDDADQTYLNGHLIGQTGSMPDSKEKFVSQWDALRIYDVKISDNIIRWDEDNVLAIRVYNGSEPGGMFEGPISIKVPSSIDNFMLNFKEGSLKGATTCDATVETTQQQTTKGVLKLQACDPETGKVLAEKQTNVTVSKDSKKPATLSLPYDNHRMVRLTATFTDSKSGLSTSQSYIPKYILTPAAPLYPRFNTTALFGVRPGSPVHFRFGVSGERPMKFSSANLPEGLTINPDNGALSGKLDKEGSYTFTVRAENAKGFSTQDFTIRVGSKIALTPPMGWNSWNCWGLSVSQEKVISSAKALIDKGLADYGYCYMNIDDGWEETHRSEDGTILVNEKFPSMKELGDWLHSEGLKFGIYSSPGSHTCGGYLGSLDHEMQDAESYNSWGIDYLKYDWCHYTSKHDKEKDKQTIASLVKPYMLMEDCLRKQPRDIFYSLCQYGMGEVWKWGYAVDANSWRTTGDITDTWESMFSIGFEQQADLHPYAQPGHWNDPDMLIVGKVGWSANLRDSRLTPDEQYTHITLWTLLASNMLIGCDIAQMDEFTVALLCNNEVNAINQDILGKQAQRMVKTKDLQIWTRPLSDGTMAVGIFNVGKDHNMTVDLKEHLAALGIKQVNGVRDLWRQQDLNRENLKYYVPSHGCKYLKITL